MSEEMSKQKPRFSKGQKWSFRAGSFAQWFLSKDLGNKLLNFIKIVESRTFDDYKKAEGLMDSKITLPDGIEIKENDE